MKRRRTRRSSECHVAIVHSDLEEHELERLRELSQQYPENMVEICDEESKVPEDIICRISIFCETSPPSASYVIIVEQKDVKVKDFAVIKDKEFKNSDDLMEELDNIVKEAVADTDSGREQTPFMDDSEEESSSPNKNRAALEPGKNSPLKRDEPPIISRKGRKRDRKSDWSDSPSFSEPETAETQKGDRAPSTADGEQKSLDIHVIVVLVIGAILFPAIYLSLIEENSSMKSLPERYHEELSHLKSTHHKQDARFWRVVNATMKIHIVDEDPRQPAVLMVASSSQTSAYREQLAREIARIYSMRCNGTDSLKVDGAMYSSLDHATAKERLDTEIHSGFTAGACAVVISNFEELPSASTTVFYQFCENDYAPYKKVLVLFTTEISNWDWMGEDETRFLSEDKTPKPQFWSRVIERFLEFSLRNRDDSGMMTSDMIGGLLTRITPLAAWVGSE